MSTVKIKGKTRFKNTTIQKFNDWRQMGQTINENIIGDFFGNSVSMNATGGNMYSFNPYYQNLYINYSGKAKIYTLT
jgi:hypothetical protein